MTGEDEDYEPKKKFVPRIKVDHPKIEWENLTEEMGIEAEEIFDDCFDKEAKGGLNTKELRKFLMWVNYNPTCKEV